MASDVLAEALARIEHKVDMLVKHFNLVALPMHFPGQLCPVCKSTIDYQIDVMKQVVVRKCFCTTGKIVLTISINQALGAPDGQTSTRPAITNPNYIDLPPAKDRSGR